ncbi:MAG TPA: aminotransferase class I/II-fold pyridoxal phosphate-dependent enzyme [Stellaceae bacterium]
MAVNPRLDALADNPFAKLRALLDGVRPLSNEPVLPWAVGEPQHEPPALLARVLAEKADLWNRYPPPAGTPEYRAACAVWLTRRYRLPAGMIEGDRHVLIANGTKEALYLAAQLAVPPRKAGRVPTVLMPNPYYNVYNGGGTLAGGEPVYLDCAWETGFLPDLDAIPESVLARCALFYLCSPANPQGAVADLAYLKKAIALARAHDFVLASDECYGEIYDRAPPPGALEACAALGGALDNVLVFHSLSKRSNAAGLRCGSIAGDPHLIERFTHLRSYAAAQVPLPIQEAAIALWAEETHVEANRAAYRRKFDIAEHYLAGRLGFYRPAGGFFLWLDVEDGARAALALWREAGIRTLPGAYTAITNPGAENPGQRYIRIAIVHDDATIESGMKRLRRVLT